MSKRPLPHEGEEARLLLPHHRRLQPQQQSSLWPASAQPHHEHHPAISDQQAAAALLAGPHDPGFPTAFSWPPPSPPGIGAMQQGPFAAPPGLAAAAAAAPLHYNLGEQPLLQRQFPTPTSSGLAGVPLHYFSGLPLLPRQQQQQLQQPTPASGLLEDSALSGWAGFAATAPQQLRPAGAANTAHYRGNAAAAAPPSPSTSWIPHHLPLARSVTFIPPHLPLQQHLPPAEVSAPPVAAGGRRSKN